MKILENLKNLKRVSTFILHHHERHDGRGYPTGLAGSEIPLGARILAVADAFDAITSDRPYRKRSGVAAALLEIEHNAGLQFDPQVVAAFLVLVRDGKIELNDHAPGQQLQETGRRC